jgi:hypothetical protein
MWNDFLDATRTARQPEFTLVLGRRDIELATTMKESERAAGSELDAVSPAAQW